MGISKFWAIYYQKATVSSNVELGSHREEQGVAGRRLTAVNRRVYSVPAHHSLFHIDEYHKLTRYTIIYPVMSA